MERTLSVGTIEQWERNANSDEELRNLIDLAATFSDGTYPNLNEQIKQAFAIHVSRKWETTEDLLHFRQLQFLRIIFRDKDNSDLDCFLPIVTLLTRITALSLDSDKKTINVSTTVTLEAEKCLVNLLFNSNKARDSFRNLPFERLISRVHTIDNVFGDVTSKFEELSFLDDWTKEEVGELLLYDLKIAFIMTALTRELQIDCVNDSEKTLIFVNVVKHSSKKINVITNKETIPNTLEWKYLNEALKSLFNIYHNAKLFDLEIGKQCAEECANIVKDADLDIETKQNAVNLLAVLPATLIFLCPKIDPNVPKSENEFMVMEGYDMQFVDALLSTFEQQIDKYEKEKCLVELLGTFFTALNCLCTEHKAARRYCRMKIIPPLKAEHVEQRPEMGNAFRNKIVRLIMCTSRCSELAAEFLFMLCKRSVGRMIKYCGFGHSAGLLANYGLLGQAAMGARRPSDSEDSETNEYKQLEEKINPITGSIPNPEQLEEMRREFESMSEEQKEYEMMKLINSMDKLMDQGLIAPGTIGDDGRLRQVKHVAELSKDAKEKVEESDSD